MQQEHLTQKATRYSRDEMNLAEFPLTLLTTRVDQKIKTLEFRDSIKSKNGELINREWIITGADKFGLPTASDDEVLLGLLKLTVDQGFSGRKIYFTRYELMKALRWTTEGRNYKRLQRALDRLSGVRIKATNAFYDNTTKSHSTVNFGIIDSYEINDARDNSRLAQLSGSSVDQYMDADSNKPEDRSETEIYTATDYTPSNYSAPSFFVWSEVLFNSFQVGYIKKLDLGFYLELTSAVSKRLYRYLDKHFWYRATLRIKVFALCHEKLGISRNYRYLSALMQQLDPALNELMERKFLGSYEVVGKGNDAEIILYSADEKGRAFENKTNHNESSNEALNKALNKTRRGESQTSEIQGDKIQRDRIQENFDAEINVNLDRQSNDNKHYIQPALHERLAQALEARGIKAGQVRRLLEGRETPILERIEKIVAYFDTLRATRSRLVSLSPVGFLYRAVENPESFNLPSDRFEPKRATSEKVHNLAGELKQRPLNFNQALSQSQANPNSNLAQKIRRQENEGEELRDQQQDRKRSDYLVYRKLEIEKHKKGIESAILERMQKEVRAGIDKLRDFISAQKFEEAVDVGVEEKIAKLFQIASFEEWCQEVSEVKKRHNRSYTQR